MPVRRDCRTRRSSASTHLKKRPDAVPRGSSSLTITRCSVLTSAFLRNVAERAPYMDAGQFPTLAEVLNHYNRAPSAPAGHTELEPLRLRAAELQSAGSVSSRPQRTDGCEWLASASVDPMTRTVDLVIVGAHPAATAAAIESARRGMRVLVVIRSRRHRGRRAPLPVSSGSRRECAAARHGSDRRRSRVRGWRPFRRGRCHPPRPDRPTHRSQCIGNPV